LSRKYKDNALLNNKKHVFKPKEINLAEKKTAIIEYLATIKQLYLVLDIDQKINNLSSDQNPKLLIKKILYLN